MMLRAYSWLHADGRFARGRCGLVEIMREWQVEVQRANPLEWVIVAGERIEGAAIEKLNLWLTVGDLQGRDVYDCEEVLRSIVR